MAGSIGSQKNRGCSAYALNNVTASLMPTVKTVLDGSTVTPVHASLTISLLVVHNPHVVAVLFDLDNRAVI